MGLRRCASRSPTPRPPAIAPPPPPPPPPPSALLCSVGFRPTWLPPDRTWRLAAIVAVAMAEAAERHAGLPGGTIRLKWPNDLVVATDASGAAVSEPGALAGSSDIVVRKLAGVLGETDGLGTDGVQAVIGIGLNAGWPRSSFPAELESGMTSLDDASGGRPIDRRALLEAFLDRLEPAVEALRSDAFDGQTWTERQLTNGRPVRLDRPDGRSETVQAIRVDDATGALVVADPDGPTGERLVLVGEIRHLRIGGVV
jgi:BirA family transcriptional regulator, biotin operon repressor / biotin---[acetyl-CoA-carboxylase] ligase